MAKDNWVEAEATRIEEERTKRMEEMGFDPIVNLVKGVNEIEIDTSFPPEDKTTSFGPKKVLKAKINGKDGKVFCSYYVFEVIVKAIQQKGPKFSLLRSGEGKLTRYELL